MCIRDSCAAWVFDASAPGPFGGCAAGESCCYLKTFVKEPKPSANMSSGIVSRGADTQWSAPPAGLRSAPMAIVESDGWSPPLAAAAPAAAAKARAAVVDQLAAGSAAVLRDASATLDGVAAALKKLAK